MNAQFHLSVARESAESSSFLVLQWFQVLPFSKQSDGLEIGRQWIYDLHERIFLLNAFANKREHLENLLIFGTFDRSNDFGQKMSLCTFILVGALRNLIRMCKQKHEACLVIFEIASGEFSNEFED